MSNAEYGAKIMIPAVQIKVAFHYGDFPFKITMEKFGDKMAAFFDIEQMKKFRDELDKAIEEAECEMETDETRENKRLNAESDNLEEQRNER